MFKPIPGGCGIPLFLLLFQLLIPAQAQTITHLFQDKSYEDFIEEAEGLRISNSGRVLVTSSEKGVLLRQDGDSLVRIDLRPGIFKDKDVSGIDQMSDGRLVMLNRGSSKIAITDRDASTPQVIFSKSGDDAGEIDNPGDVLVSVNQRIYVADTDNHRISVFNDQGLFLQYFGHHDRGHQDLHKPTHLALDAMENIYVMEAGERNRVSIFNSVGELIQRLDTRALAEQWGSKIDFSAMAADLNGILFLADDNSKQIFSYDWQQDKILNRFGTLGPSRGQYRNIERLAVNNQGQLAVLDKVNAKVEIYQLEQTDYATPVLSSTIRLGEETDSTCCSVHAFVDQQLLCVHSDRKGIKILDAEGREIAPFANDLGGVTALHSGNEMVAILHKNQLHTYRHNGDKIFNVGRYGFAPGAFDKPTHVFTAHNKVYVADRENNRVQIFGHDGQFRAEIKGGDETFSKVGPLAVDSGQNLYVVDQGSKGMIRVFGADHKRMTSIGYEEESSHQAEKIHALDIDQQDRLYALVSSEANDFSIRVFEAYRQISEFGAGDENGTAVVFKQPASLSVASTDRNVVLINDTKKRKLYRFNLFEYPDPAFGLRVEGDKEKVRLQWDSSKSPLIAEYEIQASSTESGPFTAITRSSDLHKSLNNSELGEQAWFRVVAVSGFDVKARPSRARENQFSRLHRLFRDGQYPQVIELAERLLKLSPENADVLFLKAESELQGGQFQAAIGSFQQLEQYPQYKNQSIRKQVQAYFELEQYLDAKGLIDQVIEAQPTDAEPYLICTELSIQISDAIGAVTCAEDGLALHPEHAQLRYLLGKGYILAGIDDQGLMEFDTVISANPENAEIRLRIADELMALNRFKDALVHYTWLTDANTGNGQASVGQAKALLALDRDNEAKAIAVKLSAKKATQGEGYYVLGKIALKQNKHTEAVLRLTRAGKLRPENIDAWLTLANAYVALNQPAKAVKSLAQGIKANPESYQLFEMAGTLELEQQRYPEASGYLDTAVRLNAQSLIANKRYASSLLATRNYRSAANYAERAARIAPNDVEVLTLQANIASKQGKIGSAIEFLKTAINIDSASPHLQYQLGRVYQDANLFDSSREHLEKAAAINPSWADPHVAMGQLLTKRRLFDDAIMAYEKAVELDPSEQNRALLNTAFADKKRSLEFKNNAPQLQLSDLNLQHVFSAAYKQYANQSIGSVRLKNVSGTDYGNLQLSFQIKEYMDFPLIQDIAEIKGNETQQHEFKVTFNNRILEVDEDTGVQVEVKLTFERDGQKDAIRLTQPMTIYGKNAMLWGTPQMVGSFVTPKDDTLRDYVRSLVNQFQPEVGPLNERLVSAMTYFSGLSAAGTRYIIDPNTPYTTLRDDQVDYVQFPRETLHLKSGDCDDLSVLISAGLENLGIETVLLEVPGHLFLMFNTGLPVEEAGLISSDRSLLALHNDQVWIPLEATMINASFNEAWAEGARKYQKAIAENNLGVIDLKQAWQQYQPVTLSKASYSIDLPQAEAARKLIRNSRNQLLSKSIDRLILPYQSMVSNNPKDIQARLQIAILYARYGLYDEAQMAFDALHELAPENSAVHSNQGNLFLLSGQFDLAIESYHLAARLDPDDGGVLLNLSMALYRKGEIKAASKAFTNALALSPQLKTEYAAYAKLLSQ